jgi:hypothetical protein
MEGNKGSAQAGLLARTIPELPKEIRPKKVYQNFVGRIIDYRDKKTQEKFARTLGYLSAKQRNGDLENENDSS